MSTAASRGNWGVIAGWTIAYIWFSATGAVGGTPDAIGRFFSTFVANPSATLALTLLVLLVTAGVIMGGVRAGIERVTKILMPALFVLLVVLAARAITLPGAEQGLAYYMRPDFSRPWDTFLSRLPGIEMDFLSLMATVWNNFALPIGGLLIALFVGWAWKIPEALHELRHGGRMPGAGLWGALIKYVCPVGIAIIIVFTVRAAVGV